MPFDSLSVLIVRRGTVCLPTPPSWFSQILFNASVKSVSRFKIIEPWQFESIDKYFILILILVIQCRLYVPDT